MIVSDRGRALLAMYKPFGGLSERQGRARARREVIEEKQSGNPLVPAGSISSFGTRLNLPDRALKLSSVPLHSVDALNP